MFSKIKVKLFVCTLCILVIGCISYGIYTHKKSAIPDSISLDEAIDWIDSKIQNDEGHDLYVDDFSFFVREISSLQNLKMTYKVFV